MSDTSKKKKIEIGSVQFKYADDQPHTIGNDSFRLFPHQAEFFREMVDALDGSESKFLFLESMTGSGKTIANITPAVERGENILITYPTNQLIEDQERSILENVQDFGFDDDVEVEIINSEKLREEKTDKTIAKLLDKKFMRNRDESRVFLTTPDTLYNIITGKYGGYPKRMDLAQNSLLASVSYFVFDEFHIYDVAMETSILNMCIILNHNRSGVNIPIVFSSATPDREFKELLSEISPDGIIEIDESKSISQNGTKTISGKIHLEIILGKKWNGPEVFKETKGNEIVETISGEREITAIFESVKRTSNMISELREEVPEVKNVWSYKTGMGSGGYGSPEKANLVIGTRTLSVGIDFNTQSLFFEAYRARDFLQKLGRVGRGEDEEVSEATGYTSEYSVPNLDELNNHYENKKELKYDLVGDEEHDGLMAEQEKIWGYPEDYGPIELDNMWDEFAVDPEPSGDEMPVSLRVYGKYRNKDESRPWLEDEDFLMAFRNPGVPQVAMAEDDIQLQEVMMFLEQRSSDLQEHKHNLVPEDEFLEEHSKKSPVVAEYIEKGTVEPLLFYDSPPQKDTSGTIQLRVMEEIGPHGLLRYPQDTNFRMELSGGELTREIADRMSDRNLLIYLVPEERFKDLPLPHLFKTYKLEAARGEKYRVAFGQNALKLDAHEKRCND